MSEKVKEAPTSGREYMSFEEFRQEFVDWSYDTFKRRIENEDFPVIKVKGGYLISRKAAHAWFKRREFKAG